MSVNGVREFTNVRKGEREFTNVSKWSKGVYKCR